jgi:hypothetical protein
MIQCETKIITVRYGMLFVRRNKARISFEKFVSAFCGNELGMFEQIFLLILVYGGATQLFSLLVDRKLYQPVFLSFLHLK